MKGIKVRVVGGKLVGQAPPGFVEGEEVELSLYDSGDEMSDAELAELNATLEQAWESVRRGQVRLASEVLDELPSPE